MRLSDLLLQTRREAPADVDLPGLQWLTRGGYVHPISAGMYAWLPLGQRVLERLAALPIQEVRRKGGQPIGLPYLAPADQFSINQGLDTRLKDANNRELALVSGYEVPLIEAARTQIRSYRQLPQLLFHHPVSWQDSSRPRAGICGARTGYKLEVFGLYPTTESWQSEAGEWKNAVSRWFEIWDCPVALQLGDRDPASESILEWFFQLPGGSDQALSCQSCGYAASSEAAEFQRLPRTQPEAPQPLQKVATPDCPTIESLAHFLGVPESRTAKAVFVVVKYGWKPASREELVFVVVRGDRELNENQLLRILSASSLRPASAAEIERIGACAGYASPIGLKGVRVIVDSEIPLLPNLVSGANETGYHFLNVNYERDYTASQTAPIASALPGDPCPVCGKELQTVTGVVAARLKQYTPDFTGQQNFVFIDEAGKSRPVILGCLNLYTSRIVGCLAEAHHDSSGLCWSASAAPFAVHVVALPGKSFDITPALNRLESALTEAGIDALIDDRPDSPGVKFADADLLGIPIRLTVGERGLQQGMVEVKIRKNGEKSLIEMDKVIPYLMQQAQC